MASAEPWQSRVTKTSAGIFVLCDLTSVIEYFEKALRAHQLPDMPDFVVDGTTAVLRRDH